MQHLQTKFDPRSDKPICGQLKATKVCQLQSCKFAHGCRASYNDHSLITARMLFCRDSDIVFTDRRTCWHWEHHPCTGVANNLATPPPPLKHTHIHPIINEAITDELSLIQPERFMAMKNFESAYCLVYICPAEHAITRLQWRFLNQNEPLIMCNTWSPFRAINPLLYLIELPKLWCAHCREMVTMWWSIAMISLFAGLTGFPN